MRTVGTNPYSTPQAALTPQDTVKAEIELGMLASRQVYTTTDAITNGARARFLGNLLMHRPAPRSTLSLMNATAVINRASHFLWNAAPLNVEQQQQQQIATMLATPPHSYQNALQRRAALMQINPANPNVQQGIVQALNQIVSYLAEAQAPARAAGRTKAGRVPAPSRNPHINPHINPHLKAAEAPNAGVSAQPADPVSPDAVVTQNVSSTAEPAAAPVSERQRIMAGVYGALAKATERHQQQIAWQSRPRPTRSRSASV